MKVEERDGPWRRGRVIERTANKDVETTATAMRVKLKVERVADRVFVVLVVGWKRYLEEEEFGDVLCGWSVCVSETLG
jgi:hypothetical protein